MTMTVEEIQGFLDRSPFMSFAGIRVVRQDVAGATLECITPMRPEFERGAGTGQWHGGPIAAVIDSVGDFALAMAVDKPLPTVTFRVDYLRPAINTALHAVAVVRRQGKTFGTVDIDVFNDGRVLLAIGRATYAIG
jgi:uncharacterized protein (TIGR00369 family)